MHTAEHTVKGLGEVAVRVKDLDAMCKFYEEVVGLAILDRQDNYVFFRIADGYGGHSQNLALFTAGSLDFLEPKSVDLSPERTTLHHIAFNLALDDFESERWRLAGLGLKVHATTHAWLHCRSLYF